MAGLKGYRVVIDLSNYFVDHRQKSLIFLNGESIKTVQHLINHICKIFRLDDDFELFVNDAHVPRSECAAIILEGDTIRVEKTNQLGPQDISGPCKKSKKSNKKIPLNEIIPQIEKKKKRKADKRKRVEDGIEHFCKKQHSCDTLTLEPKKKKKKKSVKDPQDGSCKTINVNYTLDCEPSKGKKKKAIQHPTDNNISHFPENTCSTEIEIGEPCKMQESTPISKRNQLTFSEYEGNLLDKHTNLEKGLYEYCGELILSNIMDESAVSNKGAKNTLCKTSDGSFVCGATKKRLRKRKRRKKGLVTDTKKPTANVSKVIFPKLNVDLREKGISNNNNHLRFLDEDEGEKMNQILSAVDVSESKNLDNPCGDSFFFRDPLNPSLDVKGGNATTVKSEDCHSLDTAEENKDIGDKNTDEGNVNESKVKQVGMEKEIDSVSARSLSEDEKRCKGNIVNGDYFEKQNEFSSVISRNHNCAQITTMSSEKPVPRADTKPSVSFSTNRSDRRRNVVIAKGIGSTLSYLLKGSKTSEKEGLNSQIRDPKPQTVNLNKLSKLATSPKKNKKATRYESFPVLENFPRNGDVLAFKILKLNEQYEPTITGYLEGKVITCDSLSTLVTVNVLGGESELKKSSGKFDIEEEEDDNSPVTDKKNSQISVELKWSEFIEPRLLFP